MSTDEVRGPEPPAGNLRSKVEGLSVKVETLSAKVDGLSTKVDGLSAKVDEQFAKIDGQFAKVDERFAKVEEQIRTSAAETRRHFDVVAEGLKAPIKVIAEGHDHHTVVLADHEARLVKLEHPRLAFDG